MLPLLLGGVCFLFTARLTPGKRIYLRINYDASEGQVNTERLNDCMTP